MRVNRVTEELKSTIIKFYLAGKLLNYILLTSVKLFEDTLQGKSYDFL